MANKIGLYKDSRRQKPWAVRWQGEYDPASGKRKFYSKSFRTKADAENFKSEQHHDFNTGLSRDEAQAVTLGNFCRDYLNTRKGELQPASLELYEQTAKRLKNYFGKDRTISKITPKDAAVFISKQANIASGKEGESLSDWSIDRIKRNCKTIFQVAVDWDLIPKNPFKNIRSKRPSTKRWHRVKVSEYKTLLEVAPTLRWKCFYALAYTSGGRLSELMSLAWNDVDFEKGRLIIANREGTAVTPPFHVKDHEARQIPLPPHTIDLLTKWQAQAPEGVPFILVTRERYEIVKAKWNALRKVKKPWRNRYMVNNVLRDFKAHYRKARATASKFPVAFPSIFRPSQLCAVLF